MKYHTSIPGLAILFLAAAVGGAWSFDGVIVPCREISVTSRVKAFLESVEVCDGQLVKPGDVICTFDESTIRLELEKASLELDKSRLENRKLKQGKTAEEIEKLKIALKIAQMQHAMLADDLEADRRIYETEGISKKELDRKRNECEKARLNVEKSRLDLQIAEEYPPEVDIKISDCKLAVKELNVRTIKDKLGRAVITSEAVRYVKEIMVNEGDYLSEGQQIAVMLDISKVFAEINVSVAQLKNFQAGQTFDVVVPLLQTTFSGTVAAIFPQIDSATGTVKIRILLDNADGALKPGMLVTLK